MRGRRLKYILYLMLALGLFSSCYRRDIVDLPSGKLVINIDWKEEAVKTEIFYVVIYPKEGNKEPIKDFIRGNGGEVKVPLGEYDIIIYDYDFERIILNLSNYNSCYATTTIKQNNLGASLDYLNNRERQKTLIYNEPDKQFYIGNYNRVKIKSEFETYTIKIEPHNIVKNYEIKVALTNPESVASVEGLISNLSPGYYISKRELSQEKVSIYASGKIEDSWLNLPFNTFGILNGKKDVYFVLRLVNGDFFYKEIDITTQINNLPNGGVIRINDTIHIPRVEVGGGGFSGNVENWGEEEGVDIVL